MKKSTKNKIIVIAVVITIVLAVIVTICLSPIFNISRINVKGNKYYTNTQLAEIVNIRSGENWFKKVAQTSKLSPKNINMCRYYDGETNVKKMCPYIKNVKVYLSGFGEYSIEVEERTKKAQISYLSSYILIDQDGVALDIVDTAQDNLPKLNGVKLESVNLGDRLYGNQHEIDAFCKIYDFMKNSDNFYTNVDYIDLSDLKDVKMFLDGRILIYFGSIEDINQYMINYAQEIFQNNIGKDEEGIIRFRNGKNPTFTKKSYA